MRRLSLFTILLLAIPGCRSAPEPDAYGNVETTEVIVSAEAGGQITAFRPREGDHLAAGEVVGTIEITALELEGQQIRAQRTASAARIDEIARQIESLEVQRQIAGRAYERTRRLAEQRAATAHQLDQAERDYRVLGKQIEAARAQADAIRLDLGAADARVAQIEERIRKGQIVNPVAGTVLATYARAGEVTQSGRPLYRIADLTAMEVRAYITETQLAQVKIGQAARITVDTGKDERSVVSGTVTWIAPDAEFTPTPIQTREERTGLVYAVKVRVPNRGGILKIGMPAEVDFVTAP
ncbi:MAG TPA: HlyD family efflux transporter periplasmic adaptor subunit [Thermoanaerobaculia bacterium]|nr:HlyD family efflux transporter periplasmic adaptor subunit [Thermoanaerobaculia bacterium]